MLYAHLLRWKQCARRRGHLFGTSSLYSHSELKKKKMKTLTNRVRQGLGGEGFTFLTRLSPTFRPKRGKNLQPDSRLFWEGGESPQRIGGRVGKSPVTSEVEVGVASFGSRSGRPALLDFSHPPTSCILCSCPCGHAVLRRESSAVAFSGCRSPMTAQVSKKSRRWCLG